MENNNHNNNHNSKSKKINKRKGKPTTRRSRIEKALHYLEKRQQYERVIDMLTKDPSIASAWFKDKSLLHVACRMSPTSSDLIRKIVDIYPDSTYVSDSNQMLPLHWACQLSQPLDIIRILVEANSASVESFDSYGRLPIHIAVESECHINTIEYLLKTFPRSVDLKDRGGFTVKYYLCKQGRIQESLEYEGGEGVHLNDHGPKHDLHTDSVVDYDCDVKYSKSKKRKGKVPYFCTMQKIRIYLISLLVVVSLVVGFAIWHSTSSNTASNPNKIPAELSFPSIQPTLMPTVIPSFSPFSWEIRNSLLNITSNEVLNNQSSPQFQAMQWIINEDILNLTSESPNLLQRYILSLFYFATNGTDWFRDYSWLSSRNECHWSESFNGMSSGKGVSCNEQDEIISIQLGTNNVTGYLPRELGFLSKLQILELERNKISGTIPLDLSRLSSLTTLNIENNHISGSIESAFASWTAVQYIYLNDNNIGGSFPASTAVSWPFTLKELNLDGNDQLQGSIPNAFCAVIPLPKICVDKPSPRSDKMLDVRGGILCECCNCSSF